MYVIIFGAAQWFKSFQTVRARARFRSKEAMVTPGRRDSRGGGCSSVDRDGEDAYGLKGDGDLKAMVISRREDEKPQAVMMSSQR